MATLECLPIEIIELIANHVKAAKCPIAPFAVASKHCRALVEPMIFSRLSIRASELPHFSHILHRPRFLALRRLAHRTDDILSDDPSDSFTRVSADAYTAYSRAFTGAIRDLLATLKENSDSAGTSHPGIRLDLCGSRFPRSTYLAPEVTVAGDDLDVDSDEDEDSTESRLRRAWLRIMEEGLPVVPVVTHFCNVDTPVSRLFKMIWPQSWSALIPCLPRLKIVEMYAFDNERKASRSREEARDAFGISLQSLPSAMTDMTLSYLSYPPANQFFDPPRLTDQRLGYDVFSQALGILSQRLVMLKLYDATLNLADFFNCSTQKGWPRLETLELSSLQVASTDGTWYFTIDPRMTMEQY